MLKQQSDEMKLTAVSHYESDMRNTVYLPVSLTPLSWEK
jgi:hypothetical protein